MALSATVAVSHVIWPHGSSRESGDGMRSLKITISNYSTILRVALLNNAIPYPVSIVSVLPNRLVSVVNRRLGIPG